MKNVHERFGVLEYTKRMKSTTTRIRLRLAGWRRRYLFAVCDLPKGRFGGVPVSRALLGLAERGRQVPLRGIADPPREAVKKWAVMLSEAKHLDLSS
jgi:hypothetical protein